MCVMPEMRMKLLEIASDELRAVVGDDSRLRFRVLLLGFAAESLRCRLLSLTPGDPNARGNG
jgi:hypothetical protein